MKRERRLPSQLDTVACPFFGAALSSRSQNQCLASDHPFSVSDRYAGTFCLNAQHVQCSIYIRVHERRKVWDGESALQQAGPSATEVEEKERSETIPALGSPVRSTHAGGEGITTLTPTDSRLTGSKGRTGLLLGGVVLLLVLIALLLTRLSGVARDSSDPAGQAAVHTSAAEPTAAVTEGVAGRAPVATATLATEGTPVGDDGANAISTSTATLVPTQVPTAPQPMDTQTPVHIPTPEPINNSAPVTPAPTSTPTPLTADKPTPVVVSAGLGMTRQEWAQRHGQPQREVGGFSYYENNNYAVAFLDNRVQIIIRTWDRSGAARVKS